jgi:2-polyprenyl-6-methoxyphenol hydroxylase-like FAD-dependent oxidoreductase
VKDSRPPTLKSIEAQILIVGAGPTGLVLAIWLTRLGIGVRIIDKATEAGTTSRALAVQARTLEFYRQLGIAEGVVDGGVKVGAINLWARGRKAAHVPLENPGLNLTPFPFPLVFPQDAHERLLIDVLRKLGVEIERGTELLRLVQDEAGVRATLKRPDGSEEYFRAQYLAGCDGARSTTRESLGIGFPGGTYQGLFYVADVEATGAAVNHEIHVDLDDADLLLIFPLRQEGAIRLVGSVRDIEKDNDKHDSLTFADVSSRAIDHLSLKVTKVNWFSTYRVHHRVANQFRMGRAFLLGDAAHIHSPVGGQGMNTGIGDSVNLAWKLAAVLTGGAAEELLETYEPERIAFARRLVATTDRAFVLATARGGLARFIRTRVAPRVAAFASHFPVMRTLLFRTVSQINVNYRKSPLSECRAGPLRAGDRLPWVKMFQGGDNFGPLSSLSWQVHIYGEPKAGVEKVCRNLELPIHSFIWSPAMAKAGFTQNGLYLVRPDGYLALVDSNGSSDGLADYSRGHGLRYVGKPMSFEIAR